MYAKLRCIMYTSMWIVESCGIMGYLDFGKLMNFSHVLSRVFFFFFFNSVLRPFQDYFSSYETGQSVGGRKREDPEKNHLTHRQAELGLSHMWPERGSNQHQTQRLADRLSD